MKEQPNDHHHQNSSAIGRWLVLEARTKMSAGCRDGLAGWFALRAMLLCVLCVLCIGCADPVESMAAARHWPMPHAARPSRMASITAVPPTPAGTEPVQTQDRTCSFEPDTDYDTTQGGHVKAISQQQCCDVCWNISTCKVGVYQAPTSTCYWKGGIVKAKHKVGVVSCVARAPPPPPPPYNCSAPGARCAGRIGATHWNPCYFINATLPSLLDGAHVLAGTGSKVIKVATFNPRAMYPFNSPAWPDDSAFDSLLSMVSHPYYKTLWSMPEFETYILIAYSTVGGPAGGSISYWTRGITEAQAAEETRQFHAAAAFLHRTYPNKTFVFENWEGDWASRGGSYNASKPATDLALNSMRTWLAARQHGITLAREQVRTERHQPITPTATQGRIFFSAEVNLVEASRTKGEPNMINRVIPYIQLDMVSYSSYDTEKSPANFRAALGYLQEQHNRTVHSPPGPAAVFVAEYGMGENTAPNSTIATTVQIVVNEALTFGCSYIMYWETLDNECTGQIAGCAAGRCHDSKHPVTDPKHLHGFWLVRPDGTKAWPYTYLSGKIAGRL
eukprot:m.423115 g.423115  ORF g.423115 m.423115 type:complete len:560 (-) comp20207_c0_seq4:42-1721(-)